jgi:hypothetical protein
MQSLLQSLVVITLLIWCFLRRGRWQAEALLVLPEAPSAVDPPHHADGKAMTIREVHIWRAMQHVISVHWPELSTVSDWHVRSYRPTDRDWGGVIRVYGMSHLELRSEAGNWEADISAEGRVKAPDLSIGKGVGEAT